MRAFKRALLRAKAKNPDRWRKRPDLRKLPISEMAPTAPPEIDSPFTGGDLTPRVLGANDLSTTTSKQLREMRLNSSKHDIVIGSTSHLCCFRRAAGPTSDTCACACGCVAVWLCVSACAACVDVANHDVIRLWLRQVGPLVAVDATRHPRTTAAAAGCLPALFRPSTRRPATAAAALAAPATSPPPGL